MEEQKSAALDALSPWSIWSRNRINESGVKGHASRERGVRVKLFEEQHCTSGSSTNDASPRCGRSDHTAST